MTQHTLQKDKLFFALLPDPDAGEQMADLAKDWRWNFDLSGTPVPIERLHVSLKGVGRFDGLPDSVVKAAKEVGAAIKGAPFELTFDQRLSFKGVPHPLVLTCGAAPAPLLALREALVTGMTQAGLDTGKPAAFVPHVTLLRDPKPLAPAPVDPSIGWLVRDFVLIHSVDGQGHTHLGRWPLQA